MYLGTVPYDTHWNPIWRNLTLQPPPSLVILRYLRMAILGNVILIEPRFLRKHLKSGGLTKGPVKARKDFSNLFCRLITLLRMASLSAKPIPIYQLYQRAR